MRLAFSAILTADVSKYIWIFFFFLSHRAFSCRETDSTQPISDALDRYYHHSYTILLYYIYLCTWEKRSRRTILCPQQHMYNRNTACIYRANKFTTLSLCLEVTWTDWLTDYIHTYTHGESIIVCCKPRAASAVPLCRNEIQWRRRGRLSRLNSHCSAATAAVNVLLSTLLLLLLILRSRLYVFAQRENTVVKRHTRTGERAPDLKCWCACVYNNTHTCIYRYIYKREVSADETRHSR